MTSLPGILTFLSALAATGNALSCTTCANPSSSSCSGETVTCPADLVCGSSLEEKINGVETTTRFNRKCRLKKECDFKGNFAMSQSELRTATTCCTTDGCTPTHPEFLPRSSEPNGLICPSCLSSSCTSCDSSETMQCKGNEKCFHLSTKHTGQQSSGSYSFRGCGTQNFCDLGTLSYSEPGSQTEIKFECSRGQRLVLTPAVTCLLLLKWLF